MSEEEEEGQTQQEEPKEEEEEEPFQRKTQPDIEALLAQAREAQERLNKEAEDEGESQASRIRARRPRRGRVVDSPSSIPVSTRPQPQPTPQPVLRSEIASPAPSTGGGSLPVSVVNPPPPPAESQFPSDIESLGGNQPAPVERPATPEVPAERPASRISVFSEPLAPGTPEPPRLRPTPPARARVRVVDDSSQPSIVSEIPQIGTPRPPSVFSDRPQSVIPTPVPRPGTASDAQNQTSRARSAYLNRPDDIQICLHKIVSNVLHFTPFRPLTGGDISFTARRTLPDGYDDWILIIEEAGAVVRPAPKPVARPEGEEEGGGEGGTGEGGRRGPARAKPMRYRATELQRVMSGGVRNKNGISAAEEAALLKVSRLGSVLENYATLGPLERTVAATAAARAAAREVWQWNPTSDLQRVERLLLAGSLSACKVAVAK